MSGIFPLAVSIERMLKGSYAKDKEMSDLVTFYINVVAFGAV